MDCCAFCTATSYAIKPLFESVRASHKATLFRDAFHVVLHKDGVNCDAFFFSYGAAVLWGVSKEAGLKMLREVVQTYEEHYIHDRIHDNEFETDEFTFSYGDTAKVLEDEITLPNPDVLTKLAFSHGISQSVKLGTFETRMRKTFNSSKQIPEDLAARGKIPLSRREIRRKMGELFIERNSINLNMDVLDTPEFFWDYPELEPYYMIIAKYLDINRRVEVLNHRLDVIHDLFEMLGNELNHLHSSRLEWIIIILIVMEVGLSLMHDVFKLV